MFHVSEGDVQSTRNVELHQRQPMENWQVGERKLDSHDTLHSRIRDIHWLYMNCIYHVQFNSSWQQPSRLVTSTVTCLLLISTTTISHTRDVSSLSVILFRVPSVSVICKCRRETQVQEMENFGLLLSLIRSEEHGYSCNGIHLQVCAI